MKRLFFAGCLLLTMLFAKTDFSEMSTEELIALIGYVDKTREERFYEELERRTSQMSDAQKAFYDEEKQRRDHAKN